MDLNLSNYIEFARNESEPYLADSYDCFTGPNNWESTCGVQSPEREWVCSRTRDHKTPHVATDGTHDGHAEVYAVWDVEREVW